MTTENSRDDVTETAGASTDQHITGVEEAGESIVDRPPTSATPAHGSSNKGINDLKANRHPDETE
jgi:fibronectin type 3 domain-containing protein